MSHISTILPTLKFDPALAESRRIEAERERTERAKVEAERLFANSGVPERHAKCPIRRHNEWDASLVKVAAKIDSGATVALVGVRGCGKTQIAVEIVRGVTAKLKRAKFSTAMTFFMDVKASYRKEGGQDERAVVKAYAEPHLLVLDEIGKRGESEWENNLLFELLNRRYNAMLPTILLCNRTVPEFIAAIGPSIASRISEGGGVIECNWESFR